MVAVNRKHSFELPSGGIPEDRVGNSRAGEMGNRQSTKQKPSDEDGGKTSGDR